MRAVLLLAAVAVASAHLSLWHPSTFDRDRSNPNSDWNSQPLQELSFADWWWHRNLDAPPPNGAVFQLPANGNADCEISSNKAQTSMGQGLRPNPRDAPVPWSNEHNGWGNMHAPSREDVAGCAWAISYKSNQYEVKPSDFVIFSVVHDCPARQLQNFQIPNLPACPNGKCMCAWFWIHKSIGGSDQMYMTPFVCNVTNARSDAKPIDFAGARVPKRCDNGQQCVPGAKVPMYWMQKEGNNMPEQGNTQSAPIYNSNYGFQEGAQNDIFVGGDNSGNSGNGGNNSGNGGNNNGRFGPIEKGDRWGDDMAQTNAGSVEECQQQCANRQGCQSFAWENCGQNICWLKRSRPGVNPNEGCRLTGAVY